MTHRLRNILLAVVLAVMAAFLTAMYVANYQSRVDRGQELVQVYVAKSDIPPGTPTADIGQFVRTEEILRKNLVPSPITDLDLLKDRSASQWIYNGEQLTARRFSQSGRGGIHSQLQGTMRAFEVSGNRQQLLAGTLRAGDHVDVVANFKVNQTNNISRILLRDVLVLRAPQSALGDSKLAAPTQGAYAVMLRFTDAQAHKFFFVSAGNESHEWWLDLRSPTDATDGPESLTTLDSAVRDGIARLQNGGN